MLNIDADHADPDRPFKVLTFQQRFRGLSGHVSAGARLKGPRAGGNADPEATPRRGPTFSLQQGRGPGVGGVPQRAHCETILYVKGTVLVAQISGTEGSRVGGFFFFLGDSLRTLRAVPAGSNHRPH